MNTSHLTLCHHQPPRPGLLHEGGGEGGVQRGVWVTRMEVREGYICMSVCVGEDGVLGLEDAGEWITE